MTLQTILDRMSLYDNALRLASGEDEVTRGILAVNLAQDWFEQVAADYPDVCQTKQTIVTAADTESTTISSPSLRRLDTIWRLDANSRQVAELTPIRGTGQHTPNLAWPFALITLPSGLGVPEEYYYEGTGMASSIISWSPIPNAVYTMRVYGLWAASDYTAAANTFAYADGVALAIAPFAAKAFGIGLGHELLAIQDEASAAFRMLIKSLTKPVRREPESRQYSDVHTE